MRRGRVWTREEGIRSPVVAKDFPIVCQYLAGQTLIHLNYPGGMSVRCRNEAEQMWQPAPGGSGYIVEVAFARAAQGVRAVGIAARHGAGEPTPEEVA